MPMTTKQGHDLPRGVPPIKSHQSSHHTESSGFARSHDKLKPLHLHYHNAYGPKTWQDGDLTLKSLYIHYHNACAYQTWQVGIMNIQ